jgi:preprotein translocase subunit SecA
VANALKAKELFKKDVEYTVLTDASGEKNGVGIIDSFTGRVLDGRRWSDGLHQSIEAMEGIPVSKQSKVIAKVTYQVSSKGTHSSCNCDMKRNASSLFYSVYRLCFVNSLGFLA